VIFTSKSVVVLTNCMSNAGEKMDTN